MATKTPFTPTAIKNDTTTALIFAGQTRNFLINNRIDLTSDIFANFSTDAYDINLKTVPISIYQHVDGSVSIAGKIVNEGTDVSTSTSFLNLLDYQEVFRNVNVRAANYTPTTVEFAGLIDSSILATRILLLGNNIIQSLNFAVSDTGNLPSGATFTVNMTFPPIEF